MRALRSVKPASGFVELCAGDVERPIVRLDAGYLRIESLDSHAIGVATAVHHAIAPHYQRARRDRFG